MKYIMTEHGFETNLEFGKLTISSNETYGFRPYQLLVSSLVSCSGGVLKKVCEKMRMPIEEMEIEVKEVVRNEEIANRLEKVHIHFKLKGSNLEEVKLQKAMNLTTKNCSMVRSVDQSIEVHETFEIM
ncbi:MAG: OsmC family protein [Planococcaceae bacterium]|nr:OsmC family protein [Bacillota bacterium]MDX1771390.1 OsmC family protein [Planococcaceae bacterium]